MQQKNLDLQNTILIVSIIILLLILFIGFVLTIFYYRRKKERIQKIESEKQFSQTLFQSQLEIQDQTLQHISRELHDNLGQIASLIKINLNTIQIDDAAKAQKIEDTKDLTRQLITDLKGLSVRLNSDRITQFGLVKTLQTETDRINRTDTFSADFEYTGADPTIAADKAIILYRMIQEILNNILKHSEAKHIHIMLNANENSFILAVKDDGIGFNAEEKLNSGGSGLFNLQNRAKLINAQLNIVSTPGNGAVVTIQMPL
jgi:signal transduction histidine kinase